MKPLAKTISVVFISIILLFSGLFYFFFETTTGFKLLVRALVPAKQLPEFSMDKVQTFPLKWMELSNVRATVLIDGSKVEIKADGAGFQMHPANPFKPPIFWIENLNIKTKDISVSNVEFKIGFEPGEAVPAGYGRISISNVNLQSKFQINNIQGIITSVDPITLKPLEGELLNGQMKAEISYDPKSGGLAAKGLLSGADMAQFGQLAGDEFKNSRGQFQTEFNIETDKRGIKTILVKAESPEPGGEMNADMFRIFLDYIPSNADKKQISEMIQARNTVPFDDARFTLKNVSEKSFQGSFNFSSRKMNIKLNVDLDVNFEDIEMLNSLEKLLQILGRFQNENG